MTRGARISNGAIQRMHYEKQQSREIIDTRQKRQKTHSRPSRQPLQPTQNQNQYVSSTSLKYKRSAVSEEDFGAVTQRDYMAERHHTDRQTLADIILMQARRIEKQQRELHRIKSHYERQVSTIKNNAIMLESHLQKVLSSVHRDRAQRIGHHYQDMFGAVENLQKSSINIKPQSVANHLLIKYLNSHPARSTNENISTYRNML
ncbi:uncharacterized protein LOC108049427 [Drosophila rhopaloa]|uniref:Uncharacterized protein LOC108049427 n=1 Tax=Drosophila rhopaloa TaxID=1041015 RepID=A0A6P4F731_DRORH|nr:uncharacterized protein LOC108049427 [Drosophila rhopaloa]